MLAELFNTFIGGVITFLFFPICVCVWVVGAFLIDEIKLKLKK
jgi:hypothetical protein